MKKLFLLSAAAVMISTGAFAQSTVVTTAGTGHAAAVQIEPEYRTRIKSYVTEHRVRPVTMKEKIIVGATVPSDVELEAVPSDWGPSLTKYRYVYSGDANIDGTVDTSDFNILAANFGGGTGKQWFQADFNFDKAVDTQKRAVAMAPGNAVLRLNLAKLYIRSGDKPKARSELETLANSADQSDARGEARTLLTQL